MRHSTIFCSPINQIALTAGGSGNHDSSHGTFTSGTASAISVGDNLSLGYAIVNSGNTNAITGAGVLRLGIIIFTGSSNLVNTTTTSPRNINIGPISFDDGTNFLDYYEEVAFTPISLGVSTAGAGTYSIQVGRYERIGERVFFHAYLSWSAHTGTGDLLLGGLPFTSSSTTNSFSSVTLRTSDLVMTNEYLQGYVSTGATTIVLETAASGTQAAVAMDTATQFMFSGQYYV